SSETPAAGSAPETPDDSLPGEQFSKTVIRADGSDENLAAESDRITNLTTSPAVEKQIGPAASEPASPQPSAFGRYEVRRTLGAGGFGAVYLGHDTQLDRAVAIKVLHAKSAPSAADCDQSLQEARKLAQLRHPGIVTVHDVGVHEGQVYVVSDYLDGR